MNYLAKYLARSIVAVIILAFVCSAVPAKPNEFKTVVNHIKKRYKAKQMRIPFVFGLVGIGARIYTRGAVKGLKIAVFQEQDFTNVVADNGFEQVFRNTLNSEWTPMIRYYSRKEAQRTYLYAKEAGKDMEILLTSVQEDNAVVVSMKINPLQLAKFIERHNKGNSVLAQMGIDFGSKKNRDSIASNNQAEPQTVPSQTAQTTAGDDEVVADVEIPNISKLPEINDSKNTSPIAVSPDPPIKADITIDTRLVNLNAKVITADGKPITTLQRDDFVLYENNVRQEISHFTPVTAPINLVLLLDFSGSTEKKKDLIKDAAIKFVESLSPNDRVAVAGFAGRFYLKSNFTTDKKQLKKVIGDLKIPSSGTDFYDSMWESMELFRMTSGSRNAIVVLTDGVDNALQYPDRYTPDHEFTELLSRIAEDDVTIYPMYLDTEYEMVTKRGGSQKKIDQYAAARKQLNQMAEHSGGFYFHVGQIEDLKGVYDRVAAELKTLYSIGYSSNHDEGAAKQKKEWRQIKLTVNRPETVARTKKGYFSK